MFTGLGMKAIFTVACVGFFSFLTEGKVSGWYERYIRFYNETLPASPELQALWSEHLHTYHKHQKRAVNRYPIPNFACHTDFPWLGREPSSVHTLHPADVDVVAAMGDSLTAGNGVDATNILQDLIEYRGLSWSGGGDGSLDEGVLTFPNILKKYNPQVVGYATGTGKSTDPSSGLNVADPGDTSFEMPLQAQMLVDRLKTTTDFNNDWKVITIFIGGNDLCDACNDWNRYSPSNYRKNLQDALDILHAQTPRALVNLALIFDIAPVAQLGKTDIWCSLVHSLVCACGQDTSMALALRDLTHAYQNETESLVATGRYNTRDDFTVVIQPFFKHTEPPVLASDPNTVDMSFFSADCFHFSGKGQGAAALSLWNNMCEAVGEKQEDWHLDQPFHCPGSKELGNHTYFQTTANSQW